MNQVERAILECRRIEENADHSAQGLFVSAGWWGIANNGLLILAGASGAAAAGMTAIPDWAWTVPWLGLLSALVCAVLLSLQPAERARQARSSALEYQALRNRARQAGEIALRGQMSNTDAVAIAARLETDRAGIAAVAPPPGWGDWAYRRARTMIEEGRTTNQVDHGTDRDRRTGPPGAA